MERHYTVSTVIIENEKTLLIFHKKFQKWIYPGGHIDPNETPGDAARREAFEETGIEVEIILQNEFKETSWNSKIIESPYLSVLHDIPSYKNEPAHQHIDFVFITRPIGGKLTPNTEETTNIKWFTIDEILDLQVHEIFPEVKDILLSIFKKSDFPTKNITKSDGEICLRF